MPCFPKSNPENPHLLVAATVRFLCAVLLYFSRWTLVPLGRDTGADEVPLDGAGFLKCWFVHCPHRCGNPVKIGGWLIHPSPTCPTDANVPSSVWPHPALLVSAAVCIAKWWSYAYPKLEVLRKGVPHLSEVVDLPIPDMTIFVGGWVKTPWVFRYKWLNEDPLASHVIHLKETGARVDPLPTHPDHLGTRPVLLLESPCHQINRAFHKCLFPAWHFLIFPRF